MMYCKLEELGNESDVEQKFITPLIVGENELGFGYSSADYYTKKSITQLEIEKGKGKKKWYSPDFIIYVEGHPVMVIEAKNPSEDLDEGYREARLYATELNSKYSSGINPCTKILAINGKNIVYGKSDTEVFEGSLEFNDVAVGSSELHNLFNFCSKKNIQKEVGETIKRIGGSKKFHKPTAIMGVNATKSESVGSNLFGLALMEQYASVFNPDTKEDRVGIVKNAYIASSSIKKYVDPIRKAILSTVPPSIEKATHVADTSKPKEILNKFFGTQRISKQLMLLVGSVGSGKTTFIHYLKEVALSNDSKQATEWVYVDLNNAPSSKEEIYKWLSEKIVEQLRESYSEKNFDDIEEIKKIYAPEIKSYEQGEGSLLQGDKKEFNKLLVKLIQDLKQDLIKTSKSYTRYLCGERGKTFTLILDNCDKRSKETQLLMFEVANWAKEEYQAVVFLPLRDITFDLHRNQPPLDTVVQDKIFRIDPPKLSDVLHKRISYAMREYGKTIEYTTENGMNFSISTNEQEKYLSCVLESIYNSTPLAKKIIDGLSGRDIRRGLGIFIDFCKSGHITVERLVQMRIANGKHNVASHIVMRALLRGDKRFYSNKNSYLKNLFASSPGEGSKVDPFVRFAVLQWFEDRKGKKGPSNIKGFHSVADLINDLQVAGHDPVKVTEEVIFLMSQRCLLTESQIEDSISEMDYESASKIIKENSLASITPAGSIHLELLMNLTYIAACAEDTWYEDQQSAHEVAARISNRTGTGQYSIDTTIRNSEILIENLIDYRERNYPVELLKDAGKDLINLESINLMVKQNRETQKNKNKELLRLFPVGSKVQGEVQKEVYKGLIVQVGLGAKGLLGKTYLSSEHPLQLGEKIDVVIESLDEARSQFSFKLEE